MGDCILLFWFASMVLFMAIGPMLLTSRESSEASANMSVARSPTVNEKEPSEEVNAWRRMIPLHIRKMGTDEGGAIPLSITTRPV